MSGSLRQMADVNKTSRFIIAYNTNNNILSLNGKALKAKMSQLDSIITGPQLQSWAGARNAELSWNHDITEKQCFLKFEVPDGAFFTTLKFVVDGTTEQVREAIQEMRTPNYAPTSPSFTPPGSPLASLAVSSDLNLKQKYPFTQWASNGEESEEEVTYVPTGPSYSPLSFPWCVCPGGGLSFEPLQGNDNQDPPKMAANEDPSKRAAKRVKKTLGGALTRKSERTTSKPMPM